MEISSQQLKFYRMQAGLTQAELAKRLKRTKACVSDWEIDRRPVPVRHHRRIAEILGVTVEQLAGSQKECPYGFTDRQLYIANNLHLLTDDEVIDLLVTLGRRGQAAQGKEVATDQAVSS